MTLEEIIIKIEEIVDRNPDITRTLNDNEKIEDYQQYVLVDL